MQHARIGIPFGTAIACLLANIALTDLDREMDGVADVSYFRYADDLLLLARGEKSAVDAASRLDAAIATLGLRCKPTHSIELVIGGRSAGDAGSAGAGDRCAGAG